MVGFFHSPQGIQGRLPPPDHTSFSKIRKPPALETPTHDYRQGEAVLSISIPMPLPISNALVRLAVLASPFATSCGSSEASTIPGTGQFRIRFEKADPQRGITTHADAFWIDYRGPKKQLQLVCENWHADKLDSTVEICRIEFQGKWWKGEKELPIFRRRFVLAVHDLATALRDGKTSYAEVEWTDPTTTWGTRHTRAFFRADVFQAEYESRSTPIMHKGANRVLDDTQSVVVQEFARWKPKQTKQQGVRCVIKLRWVCN